MALTCSRKSGNQLYQPPPSDWQKFRKANASTWERQALINGMGVREKRPGWVKKKLRGSGCDP
jgi:hypothetical protein